jgi:hypothetical protein
LSNPLPFFVAVFVLFGQAQLCATLPEKVTILVDAEFPVPFAVVQSVQPVKSGSEVILKSLAGDKLRVVYGVGEAMIAASDTDFAERLAKVQEEARIAAQSKPASTPQATQSQDVVRYEQGPARLTVEALTAFYDANELNAQRELKGKLIVVAGKIRSVDKSIWGVPYIAMDGSRFWSVQCFFPRNAAPLLASLVKGQSVAIQGKVNMNLMSVVTLDDCSLVGY